MFTFVSSYHLPINKALKLNINNNYNPTEMTLCKMRECIYILVESVTFVMLLCVTIRATYHSHHCSNYGTILRMNLVINE